jgi:hypothetical protein
VLKNPEGRTMDRELGTQVELYKAYSMDEILERRELFNTTGSSSSD